MRGSRLRAGAGCGALAQAGAEAEGAAGWPLVRSCTPAPERYGSSCALRLSCLPAIGVEGGSAEPASQLAISGFVKKRSRKFSSVRKLPQRPLHRVLSHRRPSCFAFPLGKHRARFGKIE